MGGGGWQAEPQPGQATLLLDSQLPDAHDQPLAVLLVVYRLGIHHGHLDARLILEGEQEKEIEREREGERGGKREVTFCASSLPSLPARGGFLGAQERPVPTALTLCMCR